MKSIKIGRSSKNDFVISDGVVSSSHAVLSISESGDVFIEDLDSKNGTFVNGKRISSRTQLTSSSTVLLGNHSIDWKHIIQTAGNKAQLLKSSVSIPRDVVETKSIGRNQTSQVRFVFDDISDRHAYLCRQSDGKILIIDNNSTNGTYVNGNRITAPYVLKKGDVVNLSNRHPLNWEAVYPVKPRFNFGLLAAVAASVIIIAVLFILRPWNEREKDWTKIYAEHKNDVVLVYVKSAYAATIQGRPLSTYLNGYAQLDYCYIDGDGNITPGIGGGSGTGFFISADGKFLTNRHVVRTSSEDRNNVENVKRAIQSVLIENNLSLLASNIEVEYVVLNVGIAQNDKYISSIDNFIPCTVLDISNDPELDVAVLQTNSKSLPAGSTYVDLSKSVPSDKLSVGDKICTIGFPKSFTIGQTASGLEANNQSGEITQERGPYEYGHNITIHQGASGSPVYDRRGRFAGIIVSGFLGISQGYNQAIHPTPVIDFVEKTAGH